jgi:hypothetical protein
VERTLLGEYLPAVMGNFLCAPLRSRTRFDAEFFSTVADEIEGAASRLRADYAAQAKFGKRWFTNVLFNLPFAEKTSENFRSAKSVLVAGAGPSLDLYAQNIRATRNGRFLISTDTALPALLSRGIRPDLAVSIDCQHYGYLHALVAQDEAGSTADVPFLFDLVSPPSLVRHAFKRGFFAGGHPLCQYLRRRWKPFPSLDTSGGNVSHAAVSLALSLGAREMLLYGMDFSYPDGKAYARGTYLSRFFGSRSSRFSPLDSSFFSLIFGKGDVKREPIADGWLYTTPLMLSYRDSMQRLLGGIAASVSNFHGRGLPLRPAAADPTAFAELPHDPAMPILNRLSWDLFLDGYRKNIEELPEPRRPLVPYLRGLSPAQKEIWATLLPLVPCLEKEPASPPDRFQLLSDARSWAVARIRRILRIGA